MCNTTMNDCDSVSFDMLESSSGILQDHSLSQYSECRHNVDFLHWEKKESQNGSPAQTKRSLPSVANDWFTWKSVNVHVVKTQHFS